MIVISFQIVDASFPGGQEEAPHEADEVALLQRCPDVSDLAVIFTSALTPSG